MSKYKYKYLPNDEETDYRIGTSYRGKVHRTILTENNHPRAVEVIFPDGKKTTVHKKSFEVSETAIDFYRKGTTITLKKVGYMADRRVTKWVIIRPLKYDLYGKEGIELLQENKKIKAGATNKYQLPAPSPKKEELSIFQRLRGAISAVFSRI